jgi:PAT family beta-lactamase induction signal transducer AmpG
VPSLYFAEGLPYVVVMVVSVIMYKRLGISNTEIALYTSWLYLPWVIKPLWSPIVDILRTKRFWIVTMQLLIGAGLAGVALTLPTGDFFRYSLAFLWLLAFSSATHDIAADGFYMLGLSQHDQTWFVGIRSTFYRLAMITGQGLLVILAGYLETATGLDPLAVSVTADASIEFVEAAPPDTLGAAGERGAARLESSAEEYRVAARPVDAAYADSLIALAHAWNLRHGFTAAPATVSGGDEGEEPGWWTRSVSGPLGRTIQRWFGEDVSVPSPLSRSGNVVLVPLRMSGAVPPGDEVAVNVAHEGGDPSLRIVEGERLSFRAENAGVAALIAVRLDPKLDHTTRATFRARSGNIPLAWSITFMVLTGLFMLFVVWHRFVLPRPPEDRPTAEASAASVLREFGATFASFFRRPRIGIVLAFLLLYRFAEAQLVKLASPFLLDTAEVGGLALTTGEVGFVYGTVGIVALTVGGLLGGFLAARHGLKHWLWWMVVAINLPNAVYIFLSFTTPESFWVVNAAVAVEQFGYGFGFTAYLLYMIYVSDGPHKTAHYAICTGFMALGMMIPGMFSGWLQELIGYQHFFVWVLIATIPGFVVSGLVPLDPAFGRKEEEAG